MPILSFINDNIGIKLSSIKDKTYKKNSVGKVIIAISLYFNLTMPLLQLDGKTGNVILPSEKECLK
ncbi:MAG TPA: hypothetical protein DCL18_00470 [Prevotella sp.]|nr:hypothetical protein [Prevotella sp.]